MKQFLDIARGTYSRLPPRTRSELGRLLRFVPESMKWGTSYREWRNILAEVRRNPASVPERQHRARLAMLTAAAERSEYYRTVFAGIFGTGFTPAQLLHETNWSRVPVLTPAIVRERAVDICTRPIGELDVASTGARPAIP